MMRYSSVKLARFSALCAFTLLLSAVENLIPLPVAPPGVKLGLSNLAVLYCIADGDRLSAWVLVLLRTVLSALLFGNAVSFLFSLSGGILSVLLMQTALGMLQRGYTFVSLSVLGSLAFQIGQIAAGVLLYGPSIVNYLPLLLFCGVFSGAVVGLVLNLSFPRLQKIASSRS